MAKQLQYMATNAYGRAKAEKFRAHYGLDLNGFRDRRYIDAHDYLHTVLGATPDWEDELRVLDLEQRVLDGHVILRGLEFIS